MAIDEGETITLRATFEDDSGTKADPSTPVEVTIVRPDGEEDGPFQMSKASTGVYEYEYDVVAPYSHDYRVETADGGVAQSDFTAEADVTG
jgi:hypothetical protein